jgi:parallel beta-helix repeat protein
VSDLVVEGNVIDAASREGLYAPGNDARTDTRILIANNVITGSGHHGISIGSGLKEIRIVGNDIRDTVAFKGIVIESGSEVDVVGNTVSGSGLQGIHHRGSNSFVTGNVVKNNSQAVPGGFPAIQLDGGARLTCTSNSTYDDQAVPTQYSGVWVRSSDSLVERNSGFGNVVGLITDERGAGTIIRDNSGWNTEGEGVAVFSGDQTRRDFAFAHGLVCQPVVVLLSGKSADASGEKYWSADTTTITVSFKRPPRTGTDNVSVAWSASCP